MRFIVMTAVAGIATYAQAGFNYTTFDSSNWGGPDSVLGVSGYTIEDFEDVNLVTGLTVSVTSTNGSYGPSTTIPNTFNPFADSTHGTAFQIGGGGAWDGSKGLINTRTNREFPYGESGSWGVTTFGFTGGATSVGFSIQQLDIDANVLINGVFQGTLTGLTSFVTNGSRQGYLRIDATGLDVINSVTIQNGVTTFGDGIMFDHVAFNPVPEPGALVIVGLGAVVLRRRK